MKYRLMEVKEMNLTELVMVEGNCWEPNLRQ
jgi:hypothetical protein